MTDGAGGETGKIPTGETERVRVCAVLHLADVRVRECERRRCVAALYGVRHQQTASFSAADECV